MARTSVTGRLRAGRAGATARAPSAAISVLALVYANLGLGPASSGHPGRRGRGHRAAAGRGPRRNPLAAFLIGLVVAALGGSLRLQARRERSLAAFTTQLPEWRR